MTVCAHEERTAHGRRFDLRRRRADCRSHWSRGRQAIAVVIADLVHAVHSRRCGESSRGLRQLLEDVDRLDGLLVASVEDDDGGVRTLRKATQQIEPTGLLDRIDRHHVALSEAARKWLETQDPYWLLGCFHRHVRFVGEMLDALRDEPTTVRRLTEVANERYQSGWSTLDQTRRRCMWFTCLGLVEYKTSQLVGLTDLGVEYCEILLPSKPDVLPELSAANTAVTIPEPPSHIASLLGKLTPETLIQRDPVLGYVPRGNGESDIVRSLELLVNASSPSISRADLLAFAERSFGMGSSSFGAALDGSPR